MTKKYSSRILPLACQPYPCVQECRIVCGGRGCPSPSPWTQPPPDGPLPAYTPPERIIKRYLSLEETWHKRYPPRSTWTNTCEKITFPQLPWRTLKVRKMCAKPFPYHLEDLCGQSSYRSRHGDRPGHRYSGNIPSPTALLHHSVFRQRCSHLSNLLQKRIRGFNENLIT